jgi:hypothetical protein
MDIQEAKQRLLLGEEIEVPGGMAGNLRAWARQNRECRSQGLRIEGHLTEQYGGTSRIRLIKKVAPRVDQASPKRGRPSNIDNDPFGWAAKQIRETARLVLDTRSEQMNGEEEDILMKVHALVS